jgi:hypothetical protein
MIVNAAEWPIATEWGHSAAHKYPRSGRSEARVGVFPIFSMAVPSHPFDGVPTATDLICRRLSKTVFDASVRGLSRRII